MIFFPFVDNEITCSGHWTEPGGATYLIAKSPIETQVSSCYVIFLSFYVILCHVICHVSYATCHMSYQMVNRSAEVVNE